MNTDNKNLQNDPAAELRAVAAIEMLKRIKEDILVVQSPPPLDGEGAGARVDVVERATRVLATLKLAKQGLETPLVDKDVERGLRAAERAIQEQEKWVAECERRRGEGR